MAQSNAHIVRFSTTLNAWLNNLANTGRGQKQALSLFADACITALALWLAYSLRHGMPFSDFRSTWYLFLIVPALAGVISTGLGIYRWVVRSTNRRLFRQLAKASVLSGLMLLVVMFLIPPDRSNPRSLFLIFAGMQLVGTVTMRVLWQSLFDSGKSGIPVAIYGAGDAGRQLANLLMADQVFKPQVFIDDNKALHGSLVLGVKVIAGDDPSLADQLRQAEIEKVILAMPTASTSAYQEKLSKMQELGVGVQTLPSISELVSGRVTRDQIRDVSISDILGRSEVDADPEVIKQCVTDKVVLVTGGGGSIGSELCRQIVHLNPKQLIVLDHSEENLYHITEELEQAKAAFLPVLTSVKDATRVQQLIQKHQVNTVYHAAAYKHVPIIERQPAQGVETNVFGTLNVLDAAIDAGVENFVLISTDKAVRPTNAMGASKRIAELCLQARAKDNHSTRISMVRFGNVLGSSGSVVPKFKEQIKAGGPITITHENITRYFMTIPEAAQLVLQASAIAKGGDVFVLDMGEPVKIVDLAKSMVRLSGAKLASETGDDSDIHFQFDGLRPGEKMYEELFIGNSHKPTSVRKVFTADEVMIPRPQLTRKLDAIRESIAHQDDVKVRHQLLELALSSGTTGGSDSGAATAADRNASSDEYPEPVLALAD